MDASSLNNNPLAVLSGVVAPAVLTNACSVLCLGTSNRLARVVDRTRVVVAELAAMEAASPGYATRVSQIERLQVRGQMLVRALRVLYSALGLFAATALISVVAAVFASFNRPLWFHLAAGIGFMAGGLAVIALSSGCVLMVRETRLAIHHLEAEQEVVRSLYRREDV